MKRTVAAAVVSWALLATGCGAELPPQAGESRLLLPAKPEEITVVLVGKSGRPVSVVVAPDGTYTARDVDGRSPGRRHVPAGGLHRGGGGCTELGRREWEAEGQSAKATGSPPERPTGS